MRAHNAVGLILALLSSALVRPAELRVPSGCAPATGAKAAPNGYTDRVVHAKSGIELVLVPAGQFLMGAKPGTRGVTITGPFYMGKTEVTNAQYRKFVEATGYEGKPDTDPAYDLYLLHWNGKSLMSAGDEFPVVWISWKNAGAFCKWAGLGLPTEAQWEYACRAGTTTEYHFGDNQHDFDEYGWGLTNSDALTHPVGSFKPNAWGLYDMHGNVWEWCADWYVDSYANADTRDPKGPAGGSARVLRGGSWGDGPLDCRAAGRLGFTPVGRCYVLGFRVVVLSGVGVD